MSIDSIISFQKKIAKVSLKKVYTFICKSTLTNKRDGGGI